MLLFELAVLDCCIQGVLSAWFYACRVDCRLRRDVISGHDLL